MTDKPHRKPFDNFLDEVFQEYPGDPVPSDFTGKLVSRLEKRLVLEDLLLSFGLKIGVVAGTLGILALILFFTYPEQKSSILNTLFQFWKPVITVTAVIFFTFLCDQVLLPTLFHRRKFN